MPISLTLANARTELAYLASIDAGSGTNARHVSARLNSLLNREYRLLRAKVSRLGYSPFTVLGAITTPIPAKIANEEFIELPIPANTSDVIGVDALLAGNWYSLRSVAPGQRRNPDLTLNNSPRLTARQNQAQLPVGYWSILRPPQPSGATITAGAIAIWPNNLTGSYRLLTVDVWVDITSDTDVFMLYEGWDTYLLNKCALACISRDSNKDSWNLIKEARDEAWKGIVESAPLQNSGFLVPDSYGGGL